MWAAASTDSHSCGSNVPQPLRWSKHLELGGVKIKTRFMERNSFGTERDLFNVWATVCSFLMHFFSQKFTFSRHLQQCAKPGFIKRVCRRSKVLCGQTRTLFLLFSTLSFLSVFLPPPASSRPIVIHQAAPSTGNV